ncbi:hypothetical protein [[Mycoplasma] testudinis]|uniref:hypothetical protein n=1 Tax=[Mycoplasma] testudinis TaxID=33924 RepID=UPI0004811508|nr:hypothetical protein [[Mycoplasma] testudinis]
MFSVSQILVIVLAILFLIAVVAYIVYATIFVRIRKSVNQIYINQERYNEFAANSFVSAVKPFELLSRNKSYLKPVVAYMKEFDAYYKKQLNQTLLPINELTVLKNHFDLKFTKYTSKQIENYFVSLSLLKKHFDDLTVNSSIYQNSASRLIITYRNLIDKLSLFLKHHILQKYDSIVFKDFLNNISQYFADADYSYNSLKNDVFIHDMESLRKVIHSLLLCTNNLYFLDKKADYVRYLIKEINQQYQRSRKDPNLLQPSQLNEIYRIIDESSTSVKRVDEKLHLLQFKDSENALVDLLNVLLPLKKRLYDENEAREIVSLGFDNFVKSADMFEKKHQELIQAINNVGENFRRDKDITDRTTKIQTSLTDIRNAIHFIQEEKEQRQQNYSVLLEKITMIISSISNLHNDLEDLIKVADEKMNVYKSVIHGINNLKLKYSQLETIMMQNKFYPEQLIADEFLTVKQEVNLKDKALYSDYNLAIANFDEFSKRANKTFIDTLYAVVDLASLKEIARSTFLFLNKYRRESEEIEKRLNEIQEMYNRGSYEKCVRNQIKVLEIIKASASRFNLPLN